ncbi:hypothetical protein E3N88_31210 [Mikania micrantha]|uniref:Uncharacterized protein n=1 Tax=Mikania micrantha TaxID=192012 RepID=A0A5N6MPN4_9ASTR|nr:hypothetical protein E3N88_31210 [Mikania micrantha]
MVGCAAVVRLISRSTSVRRAAGGPFSGAKASPFRFSAPMPLSHRIFRCPVELSVCLETVQPVHTVTASALMASTFILSRRSYDWLPEAPRGETEENVFEAAPHKI